MRQPSSGGDGPVTMRGSQARVLDETLRVDDERATLAALGTLV